MDDKPTGIMDDDTAPLAFTLVSWYRLKDRQLIYTISVFFSATESLTATVSKERHGTLSEFFSATYAAHSGTRVQ